MTNFNDGFEDIELTAEQQAVLNGPDPKQVTAPVSSQVAACLIASAIAEEKTIEEIAAKVLQEWAEEFARIDAVYWERVRGRGEPKPPKRNENFYKNQLADELIAFGHSVETEVNTQAGHADIVVSREGQPHAVIEVKLGIHGWRDCHQAVGQVRGYAKALKCKKHFVVAATVKQRFAKTVLSMDCAANVIHAWLLK